MTPDQVKALRESAVNIIAYENQLEAQRTKLYNELERANTNARQAVLMANEAEQEGDAAKAATFTESAELIAGEIVRIDTQIAAIDIELIEAKQASDEAKSIASNSAIEMTQMKAKGAALRADFERAKMAEATLEAEGGTTFDSVKDKINTRVVTAEARAELDAVDGQNDVSGATAMVEKAAAESKAAAKLAEIRGQLGIIGAVEDVPTDAVVDASLDAPDGADDASGDDGADPEA